MRRLRRGSQKRRNPGGRREHAGGLGLEEGNDLAYDDAETKKKIEDVGACVVDDDVAEFYACDVVHEVHSVLIVGRRGRRVDLVANEGVESSIGTLVAVDLWPHFARTVSFLYEGLHVFRLPNEHDEQRIENVGELVRMRGETASKMPENRIDVGERSKLDLEIRSVASKQLAVLRKDDAAIHQVQMREVTLAQVAEKRHSPDDVNVALVGSLQFGRKQQTPRDHRREIRFPNRTRHILGRQMEQEKHAFPRSVLCIIDLERMQRIPSGSI